MRLFDRVGRRLILTAQGEQLLVDCRRVLTDLNSVRERADVLRRGDSGALKVLAPPHTIESVLSGFLPRYAQSFPHVHVEFNLLGSDGRRTERERKCLTHAKNCLTRSGVIL